MTAAIRPQTPMMAKPRRRSAPFCFLRISSMTAWRSDLADFLATACATSVLGDVVVWEGGQSLRSRRAEPGFAVAIRVRGVLERPAVGVRQRRQSYVGGSRDDEVVAVGAGLQPGDEMDRGGQLVGGGRGPEPGPVLGAAEQGTDHGLAGAVAEQVGGLGPDQGC